MANYKMNVYIITKDKITATTKDGKWFNQLFLPLFKSNKDPLKKQSKLEDYWNEIRNVLLSKKKNPNLKVIKHKDIKFISFKVSDSQVLAFAIGSEKSDSLEDIYNLTVKETTTTEMSNKKQLAEKTTNNTESKLVEVIKKALKPFGDVKQVDEVKMNDTSRRVNIQIVTNKSDEQMWDIINEKIKPIFADKFDVKVEETSDIGQRTILCPVILSIKSNKSNKSNNSNNKAATENNKQSTVATNDKKTMTFELQLYKEEPEDFEDFSEYKKWEHHFDYLYGDGEKRGDYWDIKVENHIESEGYVKVTGKIEGVDEDEFLDNIADGMDEYGFDWDYLRSEFGDLEEEPVAASVENKEESFTEVEQDYKNGNISYEEACDLLMELGVETHSDAQGMVDVWDLT